MTYTTGDQEIQPAPIAVFAYNRPEHLRRTLNALEANLLAESSSVTVFCDGARSPAEAEVVSRVQSEARRKRRFLNLRTVVRESNIGLAHSIISGVTQTLRDNDTVIVLEDDIETAPGFLRYMNNALTQFADDERVISVHGYSYPTSFTKPFFLRGADCWGWGTWRRGWELFESDGEALLQRLTDQDLTYEFDFFGSYPFTRMLEDQIAGRNDSWAVRWYATAFLRGQLTLYPGRSLVRNIGNDGSGSHSGITERFNDVLAASAPNLQHLKVAESTEARMAFASFFGEGASQQVAPTHQTGWKPRLVRLIGRLMRRRHNGAH